MTALVLSLVLGAQPNPFLSQAKELYEGLDFEKCVARLEQATSQWQSTKDELRDIEVYSGLCQFNLGKQKTAVEHFRTALRIDETADLPPYSSPKAVDLFLKVKRSLQAQPEPFPEDDFPPDAPKKPKLEPAAPKTFPTEPGVFEKHPAPTALGIGAGVALAIGVGLGVNARNLSIQANEARTDQLFGEKAGAARANATGANVAYALAAGAAVAAVVAYLLE
ncbi:MAG: hypothetical protein Q8S33_20760 [Myxococcales bacterium]|nr:hypothetical protein [Myxococcales bacterium]MDP3502778.1 hypothetical protein [Myxococcales bacterium]